MNEWHIQSRAHGCQVSGIRFEDKQAYFTVLFEEKRELKRIDVCEAVWRDQYGADPSKVPGYISHWKGVYEAPPAAPPEAIRKESAETLLRKLIEQNDPQHGPACYILAVMLERKRLLKVKQQFRRDGVRVFVYEQPKTGDLFTITDPDLQLDQLETVQRDVADLLENGLPGEIVPAAPNVPEGSQPPPASAPDEGPAAEMPPEPAAAPQAA
jgi:hypothetical protein